MARKKTVLFRFPNKTIAYLEMNSTKRILKDKGLDATGDVQRFHTQNVFNRIGRYMPYKSGMLSEKKKFIKSNTEIIVLGPYAHYHFKGEVWGPNIPVKSNGTIIGYWSPPIKRPTGRKLEYPKGGPGHDRPGPHWDKRLKAAEGKAMAADLQRYIMFRR